MEHYRKLFPVTEKWTYLNHAANGPEPAVVPEAMGRFLSACGASGTVIEEEWMAMPEKVRQQLASLMGCRAENVAFVSNVSSVVNLVAGGLDWQPGDNVVAARGQFPANIYPWQFLSSKGVELRQVDWQQEGLLRAVEAALDRRTRVVAVSWVEFFSGWRHDLAALGRLCRERDILFLVDAIQGLGMMAMDVEEMQADVVACGAHKWLLGPEGQGFAYISPQWLERLRPPCFSWRSVEDFMEFDKQELKLLPDARRFEGGTLNYIGIIGMGASLEMLQQAGLDKVEARVQNLCSRLLDGLGEMNVDMLTPLDPAKRAGIVSFVPRERDAQHLVDSLEQQGIVVCSRKGALRISPHFYNTEAEIDLALSLLEKFLA